MVTIFTPVYNRAYIISNLYRSLKRQTDHNFEWLIVDDGSTDNLRQLVESWDRESGFPIKYRYVENGGKHRAINIGVKMARYEAFFIVDSDDYLTDDAVEFINKNFPSIVKNENYAGISGLRCSYLDNKVMGCTLPTEDYTDLTLWELGEQSRRRGNDIGDKAEVYKTSVLRRYPFPEFENENFISENVVWYKIAYDGLKLRWFNKVIYFCEYLKDGLTRNILEIRKKNPVGWAECIKEIKKYYGEESEHVFRELFCYFETMHNFMSGERMCRLLEINKGKYQELQNKWNGMLSRIKYIFHENNISSIAIYGLGGIGKRCLLYFDELGIKVSYGIDKNYNEIDFQPTYSIEMDIPKVDSICITMKYINSEIEQKINDKMPDAYIWTVKEIDEEVW